MSYILDALKRADAERERGRVPGLRAQPIAAASAPSPRGMPSLRRWVLLAGVLVVAWLATLAWRMGTQAPRAEAPVAPPVAAPLPTPAAATSPAPAPAPAPASVPVRVPKAVAAPAMRAAPPAPPPARTTSAPVAQPTAPEPRAAAPAELPEDLKRQLPAPAISGSIYSENPGQRMVTIGSQVFQEGDKPAPDLVLEQIGRKAAVFNFRGTRYTLSY